MNKRKLLSADRYADPITIDHIISLQKQLAETERQRDNALDMCLRLSKANNELNKQVWYLTDWEKRNNP